MSYAFGQNSLSNRAGIDPRLIEILDRAVQISIYDFGVPSSGGLRTVEEQAKLFTAGASKADGRTHKSYHQTGRAVDVYAYVDGKASWDHEHLAVVAAAMLQASAEIGYKLEWGGLWTGFCDRPHFQLAKD